MEQESLLDLNRTSLKNIFFKQLAEKDIPWINYSQFFKFCCTLKIYPELISSFELKKILTSVMKKKVMEDRHIEISFGIFEKLIEMIAEFCFHCEDSLKFLILHIRNMCQVMYHVPLVSHGEGTQRTMEVSGKIKNSFKLLTTRNGKNALNSSRKVLQKSISQKLSASGVFTPKNNTIVGKNAFDFRSPSLKLLAKQKNESKIEKIDKIFEKFKKTHGKRQENKSKIHKIKFIEKFIESNSRNVRFT